MTADAMADFTDDSTADARRDRWSHRRQFLLDQGMLAVLGGSLTFMLLVVVIPAKVSSLLTRDLTVGFERALSAV